MKLTRDEQKKPYFKCRGLDVEVSNDSLGRALRIMNTLVKALKRRGFSVTTSPGEKGPTTLVDVRGTQLGIRLEERYRKVEREPTKTERRSAEKYEWWKDRKYYQNVLSGRSVTLGVHMVSLLSATL